MRTHALSVDLEEYYHAENIRHEFSDIPKSRVVSSTEKLLQLFDQTKARATFFILGEVAAAHPSLIKKIHQAGHEIAAHSYQHIAIYDRSQADFYEDICKVKKTLEDITGEEVLGYRAPNFSIIKGYEWAWDCIEKAGYKYDSSVYPVAHDRYGNLHLPRQTFKKCAEQLTVVPAATIEINLGKKLRLPIAGGAYWRIFPLLYSKLALQKIDHTAFCYLHPWEIDWEQPKIDNIHWSKKIRHYYGLKNFSKKLEKLLNEFSFNTYQSFLKL